MSNYKLVKNTEWKEVEINGEMKEIPKDWDVKKFNEFSSICRGGSPRPIQNFLTDKKDGTPWIKISDATKVTKYIDSTEQYIIKEGESRSRLVYPGDLIVSNSATPGIPRFLNITACIHDGWLLLRDFKEVDKEFLFQLVGLVREKLKSQGSGSIFTNLSIDILSNFECVIPPIQTQSSIASILSEQESIIQDIESLISKYESRFQYLSDELLSGRLRVKEVEDEIVLYKNPEDNWKEVEINGEMKEIPKDWNVEKLKKHILVINGYAFPKSHMLNEKTNTSIPIIKIGNIQEDTIINDSGTGQNYYNGTIKDSFVPVYNDLIIGLSGANAGKTGIYKLTEKTVLNQRNAIVRIKSEVLTQKYFNYFWFKDALETLKETTKDSAIPNISSEDIENIDVFIFSKLEQFKISDLLESQKDLIIEQKELLTKEKQKFNWLLDNLLSGKYLVKE